MSDKEFEGLDELFDYKNQLMDDMLTNVKILELLSDNQEETDNPAEFMYKQVFPYEYVPDTVEHGQTFICCEVDIGDVRNKTFLNPRIYVWVFTHKSKVRLPRGGIRVDNLTSEIVKTINGSRMYGLGTLNLASVKRFAPVTDYQGRTLIFEARDYNRLPDMRKPIPANRKRP